jgi:hypothetical protein
VSDATSHYSSSDPKPTITLKISCKTKGEEDAVEKYK